MKKIENILEKEYYWMSTQVRTGCVAKLIHVEWLDLSL